MRQIINAALVDIGDGMKMRRVWLALASEDIGDQHRRTTLGPIWLLLNYLAFAGTFIFVFERGSSNAPNYAAYVATGLLVWFYMMETITQAISLFVREEGFIKGTTLPLSVYVMRLVTQMMIRAGYALVGCLAILFISGTFVAPAWLWSALAVLIIIATSPAVVVVCGFLGAYFPDSRFLISNIMRVGMFLTPVFWIYHGGDGIRAAFYYWNPFAYFLEIVRIPILAGELPARALFACVLISLVLWLVALLLLGGLRKQVVFVL